MTSRTSCWKIFRLIFVIFFLYLIGDAFYRWDGFRYYATFSEFLPSIALISILTSITALFVATFLWLMIMGVEWFSIRTGFKIKAEHLLFFTCLLILLGKTVWIGKLIMVGTGSTLQLKLILLFCVVIAAFFFTWLLRDKFNIIHERITPLVWLFGIFVLLSVPLVTYKTIFKETSTVVSQKPFQISKGNNNQPNIILIIFDALTTRDMSVYGYHRQTTPFIAEWAKKASLFKNLKASSNTTTPAIANIITGKRPWTHHVYHLGGSNPARNDRENFPLLLKNNGYYNMAFVANHFGSVKRLAASDAFEIAPLSSDFSTPVSLFGIINNVLFRLFGEKITLYDWIIKEDFILYRFVCILFRGVSETSVAPKNVFKRFLQVIDKNHHEPFFAWIHIHPPHFPYLPSAPYMGLFDSSPEMKSLKSQYAQYKYKKFTEKRLKTVKILRARYDEFISYCDNQFNDFTTQLRKRGILKNSVIILTSDHGESFEHNHLEHDSPHLYEPVTNIPLIIKEPGQTEERIIEGLVEQIDIPATILDLANITVPSWMEGRSLLPLMHGNRFTSRPVLSMYLSSNPAHEHQITKGTFAVWEEDFKLIYYLEENKSLLFHLKHDPGELNNLFEKESETGYYLLSLIQNNLKNVNEDISKGK